MILAVLELTRWTRLASHSEGAGFLCIPSAGIKGFNLQLFGPLSGRQMGREDEPGILEEDAERTQFRSSSKFLC